MNRYHSSLKNDFRNRVVKSSVITNRYLWHIRDSIYQDDYQIALEGLTCSKNFAVFAHNNIQSFEHTYPLYIDKKRFWEIDNIFQILEKYSFWRIDTRLANTIWYKDPNMEGDIDYFNLSKVKNAYVCSFNDIPSTALKLYRFNTLHYLNKKKIKILYSNGVGSIINNSNDFETLLPCQLINKYLSWKQKNLSYY